MSRGQAGGEREWSARFAAAGCIAYGSLLFVFFFCVCVCLIVVVFVSLRAFGCSVVFVLFFLVFLFCCCFLSGAPPQKWLGMNHE